MTYEEAVLGISDYLYLKNNTYPYRIDVSTAYVIDILARPMAKNEQEKSENKPTSYSVFAYIQVPASDIATKPFFEEINAFLKNIGYE